MAIEFYGVREEYGCFSNFSPHPITLRGKRWATSEHFFQAQKFVGRDEKHVAEIRRAKTPGIAASLGRSRAHPLRADWESIKDAVMREAVLAKFTTHADIRAVLLGTGDQEIVEAAFGDAYWGWGADGRGKNRLGEILVEVRTILRGH